MWNNNLGKIGAYSQIREIFMPQNFLRVYMVVEYFINQEGSLAMPTG